MTQAVLLFPGQGSQEAGMGRDLAQAARVSVGMMDGTLQLPPFPYSVPTP